MDTAPDDLPAEASGAAPVHEPESVLSPKAPWHFWEHELRRYRGAEQVGR